MWEPVWKNRADFCADEAASYLIHVRRARVLPTGCLRFHLAMEPPAPRMLFDCPPSAAGYPELRRAEGKVLSPATEIHVNVVFEMSGDFHIGYSYAA